MKKQVSNHWHITRLNLIGAVCLLPAMAMFCIDLISRFVQRDLIHYNRPVYNFLSHTPLYWYPILVTWVIILPLMGVVLNFIPLIQEMMRKHAPIFSLTFIKQNLFSLFFLCFGILLIAIIRLHDFAPCVFWGIMHVGWGQLPHILFVCRSA